MYIHTYILRVRTVKFGVSVRTLDTIPALNFVKKKSGGFVPWGKFLPKIRNFRDFLEALISISIMLKFH